MSDMRWFDPNVINEYYQQGIRGMRTNIDGILDYIKGNDFTQNAINKGREAYNTFFGNQNAEAKAQQGRFQAKGTKETVGPNKVKMSQIQGNIANKGIDPNNLKVPIDPTKEVNINVNPQTVAKAPKTGLLGKTGKLAGKATPWLVGGLGAWGTISNWNKPGSDWVSRAMDATAPIVGVGAPLLGARFGVPGLVAGTTLGILGGIHNANQADLYRQSRAPYEENYLKNPDFIRQKVTDNLRREAKNLGMSDEEANAWVTKYLKGDLDAYRYAQQYGRKKPLTEKQDRAEGQEQFQFPFMDKNNYLLGAPVGSLPELPSVDAQSSQNAQEGGVNTPQDINSLVQALTLLKEATGSSNNYIPTPNETLATLLQFSGYPQYGQQLTAQQPEDNRDFSQRIYDRVDDIRSLEGIEQDAQNRPELRPKAEIEQPKAEAEQPKTSDEIMLDKLNQLNELVNNQNQYRDYDPIQRMWIARAGGMTPYQVWGDYPNQNTRLKNIYEALNKEYEIRKDIEDRDRIKKAGEALSQKFVDDPMLQYAIASGVDASKIAEMLGIPEANKFPYEMATKAYDRTTDLFKNYQTGMNTLGNTALQQSMITGRIYPNAIADLILQEHDKTTPSQKDIDDYKFKTNKFNSEMAYKTDKANLDAMMRWAKNGGANNPKLNDYINTAKFYADNGDLDTAKSIMEIVINNLDIDAEDVGSDLDYNFRGVE